MRVQLKWKVVGVFFLTNLTAVLNLNKMFVVVSVLLAVESSINFHYKHAHMH